MSAVDERLSVAGEVARFVATPHGQALLRGLDCTVVVAAGRNEPLSEVVERVVMGAPPAIVVTVDADGLQAALLRPGRADDDAAPTLRHDEADIAELFQAMVDSGQRSISIRAGDWLCVHASPLPT